MTSRRSDPIVKATWYGRASDPFIRVVETYEYDARGYVVKMHRNVLAKASIDRIVLATEYR